MTGMDD